MRRPVRARVAHHDVSSRAGAAGPQGRVARDDPGAVQSRPEYSFGAGLALIADSVAVRQEVGTT